MIPCRNEGMIAPRGAIIVGYLWQCRKHSIDDTEAALRTGELRGFGINCDPLGLPKLMLDRNGELVIPLYASSLEF